MHDQSATGKSVTESLSKGIQHASIKQWLKMSSLKNEININLQMCILFAQWILLRYIAITFPLKSFQKLLENDTLKAVPGYPTKKDRRLRKHWSFSPKYPSLQYPPFWLRSSQRGENIEIHSIRFLINSALNSKHFYCFSPNVTFNERITILSCRSSFFH